MALRLQKRGITVTIFSMTALAVLAMFLVLLSVDKKFFSEKFVYTTWFNHAAGLSGSTPILFKGFEIGRVRTFTLDDNNRIQTAFYIFGDYQKTMVAGSVLKKSLNPLTGGASLALHAGENMELVLPEGSYIPSTDSDEGQMLAGQLPADRGGDVIFSTIDKINSILDNLNTRDSLNRTVLYQAAENAGRTFAAIESLVVSLDEQFQRGLAGSRENKIGETLGNLADASEEMKLVTAESRRAVMRADSLLAAYQQPEGLLKRMVDPDGSEVYSPLRTTMNRLDSLLIGHTEFIRFMNTETAQLTLILSELSNVLEQSGRTLEGVQNNPLLKYGISDDEKPRKTGEKIRLKDWRK